MNSKEFLLISITIFFTVLAWIVADIYHTAVRKSVLKGVPRVESLNVSFDSSVFDKLKARSE